MENFLFLTSLLKTLSENKKYTYKCFVGDFNFKDIEWPSMSTHEDKESKESKFIETIQDCFLYQDVTLPTRCRGTDRPSTIDLALTNEEKPIGNLSHLAPLGKSDHCFLSFEFIENVSVNLMSQKRYQNTSTTRPITDQCKPISESQIGSKTFWLIILQTHQDCGIYSKQKSFNSVIYMCPFHYQKNNSGKQKVVSP